MDIEAEDAGQSKREGGLARPGWPVEKIASSQGNAFIGATLCVKE